MKNETKSKNKLAVVEVSPETHQFLKEQAKREQRNIKVVAERLLQVGKEHDEEIKRLSVN